MSMLQGNTYLMPIRICDADGGVIKGEQVEKGEFVFGEITKFYGGAEGEVVWDESREAFILPLSEEETFGFKGVVEYQGRVLLKDGSVSGSVPKSEDVYASIGTARLSDGGAGEESGEILTIRLLDRVINTGITEEVDPTVPQYVKEISKQDIENWNKVNKLGNVFKYKGSVQTYADLPAENNQVGDTYNVIEAYGEYGAGTNFAWSDAGEWDALSGIASFDADGYVTIEEYNKLLNNEVQIKKPSNNGFASCGGGAVGFNSPISIGEGSQAQAESSIGIGYKANSAGNKAIQLGAGSNVKAKSLQIYDDNIYDAKNHILTVQNIEQNGNKVYGILQGETAPTETTAGYVGQFYLDTVAKKLYQCVAGHDGTTTATTFTWQEVGGGSGGVSQEDFDKLVNNETQIGNTNNSFKAAGATNALNWAIAIGLKSSATYNGVALGENANVGNRQGVAIGYNAVAGTKDSGVYGNIAIGTQSKSEANKAIQLGTGTNSTENSLQIASDNIYNHKTHTLTVQNITLNGVDLGSQLVGLNTALEAILGV